MAVGLPGLAVKEWAALFSGLTYGIKRNLSLEAFACERLLDAEEFARELCNEYQGCAACPSLSKLLDFLTQLNSGAVWCMTVCGAWRLGSRAVNQNMLPSPGLLLTPIVPPMSSTSRLETANPKPVPPYFRVIDPSPWEKAWNNRP